MANTNTEIEWRDIKGFEGKYMVSNTELVKSLKR
ncbi:NUMOD4 domain-containing protein [Lactococcus cremoris]